MEKMSQNEKQTACFRGLGNMGSKVIYLSGLCQPCRTIFQSGFLIPDALTSENLTTLTRLSILPQINSFPACSPSFYVDFTHDANPWIESLPQGSRIVVQSNNYGLGSLVVPPLGEVQKPLGNLVRAPDCSLSGVIPFLSKISKFFLNINVVVLTDRGQAEENSEPAFYFSDSFARRRSKEVASLLSKPVTVTSVSSSRVGPFYLANISGRLDEEAVLDSYQSFAKFEKDAFSQYVGNCRRIAVSVDDNTQNYRLPPEPKTIGGFMEQYSQVPLKPPIIYFRRSFQRRGDSVSLTIGFDVNLTPALSNLDIFEYISGKTLFDSVSSVDSQMFGN